MLLVWLPRRNLLQTAKDGSFYANTIKFILLFCRTIVLKRFSTDVCMLFWQPSNRRIKKGCVGVLHLLLGFLESSIQLHIKSYICFCLALAWSTSMEKLAQGSRPIPLCLMLLMDGMCIVVYTCSSIPSGMYQRVPWCIQWELAAVEPLEGQDEPDHVWAAVLCAVEAPIPQAR